MRIYSPKSPSSQLPVLNGPSLPRRSGLALLVFTIAAFAGASVTSAEGSASAYRAQLEKWVEARQLLSKERADWLVDRDYLKATRDLLVQERDALRAEIAEYEETNSGADDERRDLLLERGE